MESLITETKVMVRVYIVQGLNLRPCDKNGDSDPYIQIEYGNHKVIFHAKMIVHVNLSENVMKKVSDKAHFVQNQTNPVFGKRFLVSGVLPK